MESTPITRWERFKVSLEQLTSLSRVVDPRYHSNGLVIVGATVAGLAVGAATLPGVAADHRVRSFDTPFVEEVTSDALHGRSFARGPDPDPGLKVRAAHVSHLRLSWRTPLLQNAPSRPRRILGKEIASSVRRSGFDPNLDRALWGQDVEKLADSRHRRLVTRQEE